MRPAKRRFGASAAIVGTIALAASLAACILPEKSVAPVAEPEAHDNDTAAPAPAHKLRPTGSTRKGDAELLPILMQRDRALLAAAADFDKQPDWALIATRALELDSLATMQAMFDRPDLVGADWPRLVATVDSYRLSLDRFLAAQKVSDHAQMVTELQAVRQQCDACHKIYGGTR